MLRKSLTAMFLALTPVGALSLVSSGPAQAQQVIVSITFFHQQLASYGRWFDHPQYGWTWFPTAVDARWRPYSRGQWVWTEEYGWYWQSDEPFGWATYHYGRWAYDEEYGWIWIPGNTWGPAWVAFRYSEGYVGWAPLPPETLDFSFGFSHIYTDMSARYYEPRWVFVPRNRFLDARIYTRAEPMAQNNIFIRQTINVTNYITVNRIVVNRSIDRQRMETALGRRITAARVRDVDDVRKSGRRGDSEIDAYRPQVRVSPQAAPPAAARARPNDKPPYSIQKDATPPSERRDVRTTAPPGQPPARTTPPTGQPPARTTPPSGQPPARTTPPTGQPPARTTPPTGQPPARTTPPTGQPPARTTPPTGQPPARTTPPSGQPPARTMPPTGQPPARTTPPTGQPPARTTPPSGQPPARTAPPSRQPPSRQPPAQPPCGQPGQPACPPR